jgi:hypothetical protein
MKLEKISRRPSRMATVPERVTQTATGNQTRDTLFLIRVPASVNMASWLGSFVDNQEERAKWSGRFVDGSQKDPSTPRSRTELMCLCYLIMTLL